MQNTQTFRGTFLLAAAGIVIGGAVIALRGQAPATDTKLPAFEVASVKPHKSVDQTSSSYVQLGGRYTATNATLRMLMRTAYAPPVLVGITDGLYGAHDDQIVGGPSWTNSERFDIVAKAEGNPPLSVFRDQARLMLRQLLADRFKLALHHETREISIYALVIAGRDGKLGPQLRRSDAADCTEAPNPTASTAPNPNPNFSGAFKLDSLRCGLSVSRPGHMAARATIFSTFVTGLSSWTDRLVFDRTALAGSSFDWDLQWMPEQFLKTDQPNATSDRPSDSGISLLTALQEQLGLKLDSQEGPVDVLVIDHVEQPTPD